MNDPRGLERVLRVHFESRANRTVLDGQLARVLAITARTAQRPAWLVALRSNPMTTISIPARPAIPRAAWLLIVLGLILALALAALYVGRPSTPFNGRIVYGRMDKALGDTVIYTINPDGSHGRQLRPETHEGPHWSPSGDEIGLGGAFVKADGSRYREAPLGPGTLTLIDWAYSPDGTRLLCEGFVDGESAAALAIHGIYTVRASDGGDMVRVTQPGDFGVPGGYSPDGRHIVYMQWAVDREFGPVFIVDVDGTNRHQLGTVTAASVDWSPDGRSILATGGGRLFTIDVATGTTTRILIKDIPEADIYAAVWSPDGTRILFSRPISDSNTDLFTMKVDGSDLVRVTNDPDEERFMDWGTHPLDG
jgi:hypothetical protein